MRLTRGLSWDQKAEDIMAELEEDSALRSLCACRHPMVTLASEGALWLSTLGRLSGAARDLGF